MNLTLLVLIAVLPLIGAILAGLFGRVIGRAGAHTVTIWPWRPLFAVTARAQADLPGRRARSTDRCTPG